MLSNPLEDIERQNEPAWRRFVRWCAYAVIVTFVIMALSDLRHLGEAAAEPALALLIGLPLLAVYLLPALIADYRHHRNRKAIMVLNIFLGWTFLGWVIALVWSLTADTEIGAESFWDRL